MLSQNHRRQLLKDTLKDLSWTHARLAEELEMSERNIRRYVAGDLDIPMVVCLALRWIAEGVIDK